MKFEPSLAVVLFFVSACSASDPMTESVSNGQNVDASTEVAAAEAEALTSASNCSANYNACAKPCVERRNRDIRVLDCLSCIKQIESRYRACINSCAEVLHRCEER